MEAESPLWGVETTARPRHSRSFWLRRLGYTEQIRHDRSPMTRKNTYDLAVHFCVAMRRIHVLEYFGAEVAKTYSTSARIGNKVLHECAVGHDSDLAVHAASQLAVVSRASHLGRGVCSF